MTDQGSGQVARLDIAMIASIRKHLASVEYKGHVFRLTRDEVAGLLAAVDERDRLRAQLCAEPDEVNA